MAWLVHPAARWVSESGKAMGVRAGGLRSDWQDEAIPEGQQLLGGPRPWDAEGSCTHPYEEGGRITHQNFPTPAPLSAHLCLTCSRIDTAARTSKLLTRTRRAHTSCMGIPARSHTDTHMLSHPGWG